MCGLITGLTIASLAIAAAGATSTAVAQKKASDKQKDFEADRQRKIDAKAAQENAFYRMEYYRDPMRTAEGANALKQIRDYNQRLTDIQKNRNVITGGTQEQTIAQQGRAMKAYADAVSNIRADNERTRRYIGQNWLNAQNNQFQRQMSADESVNALEQQSYQNAVNNIQNFQQVAQSAISATTASKIPPSTYNGNAGATGGVAGGNFANTSALVNSAKLYDENNKRTVVDPNTGLRYQSGLQF